MPDITMCSNKNCPLKDECFRFKAKPSDYYQSYASFYPNKDGTCDWFIKIVKE